MIYRDNYVQLFCLLDRAWIILRISLHSTKENGDAC